MCYRAVCLTGLLSLMVAFSGAFGPGALAEENDLLRVSCEQLLSQIPRADRLDRWRRRSAPLMNRYLHSVNQRLPVAHRLGEDQLLQALSAVLHGPTDLEYRLMKISKDDYFWYGKYYGEWEAAVSGWLRGLAAGDLRQNPVGQFFLRTVHEELLATETRIGQALYEEADRDHFLDSYANDIDQTEAYLRYLESIPNDFRKLFSIAYWKANLLEVLATAGVTLAPLEIDRTITWMATRSNLINELNGYRKLVGKSELGIPVLTQHDLFQLRVRAWLREESGVDQTILRYVAEELEKDLVPLSIHPLGQIRLNDGDREEILETYGVDWTGDAGTRYFAMAFDVQFLHGDHHSLQETPPAELFHFRLANIREMGRPARMQDAIDLFPSDLPEPLVCRDRVDTDVNGMVPNCLLITRLQKYVSVRAQYEVGGAFQRSVKLPLTSESAGQQIYSGYFKIGWLTWVRLTIRRDLESGVYEMEAVRDFGAGRFRTTRETVTAEYRPRSM
jgi:hypothetical protein